MHYLFSRALPGFLFVFSIRGTGAIIEWMTVDTLIYLRRSISDSERLLLDQGLRRIRGIVAPWFTPAMPSAVLVYFNPELTDMFAILAAVKRLGYDGRIVSL